MSLSHSQEKVCQPEEMNPAFAKAFNSGKLDNLSALFEQNAILFDHGNKPHQGRGPVRETLEKLLRIEGTMVSTNVYCVPFEDIALLRCRFVIDTTDTEGNPTQIKGFSSEIARKQPDGSWLYIIDHPFGSQPLEG